MSKINVGTCGYGYYQPEDDWKEKYESKLQAYSDFFKTVEINKTFYKLPMVKTAEKWKEKPKKVEKISNYLDIIHVVDLLRRKPTSDHPIAYIRLHGLNPNEYDYDYDYSDEELHELAEKLEDLSVIHDRIYCMFNNYEMFENAKRVEEIL